MKKSIKSIRTSKNKKIIFKLMVGTLVASAIAVPNFLLYNLKQDLEKTQKEKTNLKNSLDLINSKLTNAQTTIENLQKVSSRLTNAQTTIENLRKENSDLENDKIITKILEILKSDQNR